MTIEGFQNQVEGKQVVVIGIGVSNLPLISFLLKCGAKVTAHDKRTADELGDVYQQLVDCGVTLVLGAHYLDEVRSDAVMIFKTPGLRYDVEVLRKATAQGIPITSEMELFFSLCPATIIGVTGSDGKTTTTSLIYDMLVRGGYTCFLGGNIGKPLIGEVQKIKSQDVVVVELSSFQLHTMKQSPHIAVVTNVTPNHLDWHTDLTEYIAAKKAIFLHQKTDDRTILNYDNDTTRKFATETKNPVFFGRQTAPGTGYGLDGGWIVYRKDGVVTRRILDTKQIYIPGQHNIENYMAAIAAVEGMVPDTAIQETAVHFHGVPHRIEFVREVDGVKYYNDSIASSPARTTAGLRSFSEKVILIAGGYDKKIPFDAFGTVVNAHVKALVLCGLTADKIRAAVEAAENYSGLPIYQCDTFENAVLQARNVAVPGDIVILSPACASFDQFKNFEERGNRFKSLVQQF